jgi:glycosyltransferase involved in cell wall biosynthesis
MKAGLPVLSTATEGPRELLRDQPGVLVPINQAPALGRALRNALAGLRGGMHGQREPVRYNISAYDRQNAVRQVIGFYGELLAPRSQAQHAMPSGMPVHA